MARRGTPPAVAASLPDDDDMLREILLRLPPQPSSLPRASAVCKRWRGLVTDPLFHRQFYAHHRKPPVLGAFVRGCKGTVFAPMLGPPDRIPPQRFDLGRYSAQQCRVLDCRHGLVLVKDLMQEEVAVCSPISGEQRLVQIPSEFRRGFFQGAVLCAAAHHAHGRCHSSPFKVVLVSAGYNKRPTASVYSSETGLWGSIISTEAPCQLSSDPVVLVGNCLYWLAFRGDILVFDLDDNSLTVIKGPPMTKSHSNRQIFQVEDGALGFATMWRPHLQLWKRNVSAHGVATWVPWLTIEMHTIHGLRPYIHGPLLLLLGYDEDTGSLLLHDGHNIYGLQLKLMQSRKLCETNYVSLLHPFKSFYAPGTAIADEVNAAEMLHIG